MYQLLKLIEALLYYYVSHEYYMTRFINWRMIDNETVEVTFESAAPGRKPTVDAIKIPLKRFCEEVN